MNHEILKEGDKPNLESVCFIFFNQNTQEFLVETRPDSNPNLGGLTVFPGEKMKYGETPPQTLRRGIAEEMGDVSPTDWWYIDKFYHSLNQNKVTPLHVFVVSEWEGEIKNTEPEKGIHKWISREDVFKAVSKDISAYLLLVSLTEIGQISPKDFENAPKINIKKSPEADK